MLLLTFIVNFYHCFIAYFAKVWFCLTWHTLQQWFKMCIKEQKKENNWKDGNMCCSKTAHELSSNIQRTMISTFQIDHVLMSKASLTVFQISWLKCFIFLSWSLYWFFKGKRHAQPQKRNIMTIIVKITTVLSPLLAPERLTSARLFHIVWLHYELPK